ncbi:hypothetical protein ACJIZ3_001915 [Penstemon smallii]|uniref:Uncharacterized protein n=1 Tax=Penstemon smallii TaxID=265156 RepID=A0ABD3U624_9LAMI
MSMCMAIASRDGIGSANKPSRCISAERAGLATIKELRSSSEFRCLLNSLGRLSSCRTKLSITLLRSKGVIPVFSNTVGNSIVTATLFSPYIVHQACTLPWTTTWEDGLQYNLSPANDISTEGLDGSGATTVRNHFAVVIAVLTGVADILDIPPPGVPLVRLEGERNRVTLVRLEGERKGDKGLVIVFVGDDTESIFLYRIRKINSHNKPTNLKVLKISEHLI